MNIVNYVCTAFAILDYSVDVITQFEVFLLDNFEQYVCSIHESIG